jgi:methionyl-tRNA formyltransferase
VPSLEALIASSAEVVAVVTNPDRPAGRGMELQASPVKALARRAGLDVLQPPKARDPDFHEAVKALDPDVAVVVAYGKILPRALLEIPPLGFVNVHFSLLPAYRGAAPVQHALIDGAETTGVSIMVLTEGMDEGPVLATEEVSVEPSDNAGTLGQRMANVGARLLVPTLEAYASGELTPIEQDHSVATYASKLDTEAARLDWSRPAETIRNLVRAFNPEPGAWTTLSGTRLKVLGVDHATSPELSPGELRATDVALLVGCGDGALVLDEVQLAGKTRMRGGELARGLRLTGGETLE